VAASPDGRDVYVASGGSDAVAAFRRDQATEGRQLGGRRAYARARAGVPSSLTVSPEGHHVYVAGFGIAVLVRDQATGGLRQLGGRGGCASFDPSSSCARGAGLMTWGR
jgi:DNA-binding beta-propeller fold protein YncE